MLRLRNVICEDNLTFSVCIYSLKKQTIQQLKKVQHRTRIGIAKKNWSMLQKPAFLIDSLSCSMFMPSKVI